MDRNRTQILPLVFEKNEFAYRFNALAHKKTADKKYLKDISTELEKVMMGEDFVEENWCKPFSSKPNKKLLSLNMEAERLRIKFK